MRFSVQKPARPGSNRTVLALFALVSVMGVLAFMSSLTAHPSIADQVQSALGCRSTDTMLMLTLRADGQVLWPDGTNTSVEEAKLLIPAWCQAQRSPVLAILADRDSPMQMALPLLGVVQDLGIRRAILATIQGNVVTVQSNGSQ